MLVHISPGHHGVTAVSIPRDAMAPEYQCDSGPGYTGQQANPAGAVQVNSLLQIGGPTCLWKTVEQMTGVRIDHFIGIGLLGFVKVVNDLGGVNVCVPFTVNDQVSGLNLKSGEQHISGIEALAFGGPARTSATAPTCSESSGTSSCPPRWSRACCIAGCCPTRSGC